MTVRLRGMTWNHIRGYGPLMETSRLFQKLQPNVEISWERRSLKDFGDYPIDMLAQQYDLIMIDHPHVGLCAEQGVLEPLDSWLDTSFLQELSENSVGPSHDSYAWNGRQWALAVDAAAQVAAYREDLWGEEPLPATWDSVMELAAARRGSVGWPLCPTDAMCSFITLCAQISGGSYFDEDSGLTTEVAELALERMLRTVPDLHPQSLAWNPIQMLDHMAASGEIAYIPLTFGYTNYSRAGYAAHRVRFGPIPSDSGLPEGAILGGVGMAVSSRSRHIAEAMAYAAYTASEDIQRTAYLVSGGQPGHRKAWTDTEGDALCGGFFSGTLGTLDRACIRPRIRSFPQFQEEAGVLLHGMLLQAAEGPRSRCDIREAVRSINRLYVQIATRIQAVHTPRMDEEEL